MQWAAFLAFTATACYTPGPNIIIATNTARLFGFRRTVPLMSGMTAGLLAIMSLNAAANIIVADLAPKLLPWLRLVGAAYLFAHEGTTWTERAYIKASNPGDGDFFAYGLALGDDTLCAGSPGESGASHGIGGDQTSNAAPGSGAVYCFR